MFQVGQHHIIWTAFGIQLECFESVFGNVNCGIGVMEREHRVQSQASLHHDPLREINPVVTRKFRPQIPGRSIFQWRVQQKVLVMAVVLFAVAENAWV